MEMNAKILVVSRDRMLLQTRQLILGAYFQVEAAVRLSEVGTLLAKHDFDIIVLCDTLSDTECLRIADLARGKDPRPALLSVVPPGKRRSPAVEGRRLTCGGGPFQLLKECAETIGLDVRSKPRLFAA